MLDTTLSSKDAAVNKVHADLHSGNSCSGGDRNYKKDDYKKKYITENCEK